MFMVIGQELFEHFCELRRQLCIPPVSQKQNPSYLRQVEVCTGEVKEIWGGFAASVGFYRRPFFFLFLRSLAGQVAVGQPCWWAHASAPLARDGAGLAILGSVWFSGVLPFCFVAIRPGSPTMGKAIGSWG